MSGGLTRPTGAIYKREITFPVVGTRYIPGCLDFCGELSLNENLELRPNPQNPVDSDAIEVWARDTRIGYVPNKGITCTKCWSFADGLGFTCPQCGADYTQFVKGGLASRLVRTKALQSPHACYVEKKDEDSPTVVIYAQLLLK